jgi:hypothetical protein
MVRVAAWTGVARKVASSNSNDRLGYTSSKTFEHALIGSDYSKSHRADKSSQRACRGRSLLVVDQNGLLTPASYTVPSIRCDSSSEPSSYSFFFTKTPMTRGHPPKSHDLSLSNLVNSNFLD